MRLAFTKALIDEARKNPKIFLVTGDLGFRILEPFKEEFPKRFLNIGVAEANLVTVAAGLSSTGFIPFIYSIGTFASMRPFEQIRNDISLQNRNVKIVAVGAGIAYNKAGPTHHSMEDIAIIRSLPNMTIVAPSDTNECYQATRRLAKLKGPAYLRIERNPEESQIPFTKPAFELGKGQLIKGGEEIAILVTGTKIPKALTVSKGLAQMKIDSAVFSFPTISPLDKDLLSKITTKYPTLITLEEHRIDGGFGSAVAEFITGPENPNLNKLLRFGLKNSFSKISAEYNTLLEYHEFTPRHIVKTILNYKIESIITNL